MGEAAAKWDFWIDRGGTFTDVVARKPDGSYAVGKGLEKFFSVGHGLTREERRHYYDDAVRRGRGAVSEIVDRVRSARANSSATDSAGSTARPAHG